MLKFWKIMASLQGNMARLVGSGLGCHWKNRGMMQEHIARCRQIRYSTALLPTPSWHDGRKRGTMLRGSEHYLRLHSSSFLGVALREKLENTKEVILGFGVFVVRFSLVGKYCKHLG
jgi:hypothetical protein